MRQIGKHTAMPKTAVYAARSLYLGVSFYLAAISLSIVQIGGRSDAQFMLFLMTLALCAIYCLLVSRASERSKLALILLSIVGVVSAIDIAANAGSLFEKFQNDPFVVTLGFGATCLQTTGLVLLFAPSSREWFRQRPQSF
jgi:ribose/xylose/arabinose/galactoside ABC-type transport system permease subunit